MLQKISRVNSLNGQSTYIWYDYTFSLSCRCTHSRIYLFLIIYELYIQLQRHTWHPSYTTPIICSKLEGHMSTQKQGKKHRKNNDPSPTTFDNTHYRLIHKKKMDHSLLTTQKMKSQADLTGTCLKEEKTDEHQEMISGVFYSDMLLSYCRECDSTVLFQVCLLLLLVLLHLLLLLRVRV